MDGGRGGKEDRGRREKWEFGLTVLIPPRRRGRIAFLTVIILLSWVNDMLDCRIAEYHSIITLTRLSLYR